MKPKWDSGSTADLFFRRFLPSDRGSRLGKEGTILKQKNKKWILLGFCIWIMLLLAGIFLTAPDRSGGESIREVMRDAVLHEKNRIRLFGDFTVNPGLISAFTVTGLLLAFAAVMRIFVSPRFQDHPGRMQKFLEALVGYFDDLARKNSPHQNGFLGAYLFGVGVYIFFGTCFELFGWQVVTTAGRSISMPTPISDINGAIAVGCISFLVILSGGITGNSFRGLGSALKEFSLPISMSFRLFGAMLSGLLVTELVYASLQLSFVLPVLVAVLFTLLHAIIQTYVLTMLTAVFYGEVSEPSAKKKKQTRKVEEKQ